MKNFAKIIFALVIFAPIYLFGQQKNASYQVNDALSSVKWTGYGAIGSYSLTGTLKLQKGTFKFDKKKISGGVFVFDMNTISHEEKNLEKHLKGEDFFDVPKFPTATFELNTVEKGLASGFLTIKNIKKPISFPVKIVQKDKKTQVIGTMSVDRTLFGITYNSSSFFKDLGEQAIKNNFDLSFDLAADQMP